MSLSDAPPVVDRPLLDPAPVAALQALFDDGTPVIVEGDPLPPLWHWVALPTWIPSSALGRDGHPTLGVFPPPEGFPRRMFAGGSVTFHTPLTLGSQVERTQQVVSATEKSGRSGRFVIVQVRTRLVNADGQLAVEEHQDLVYREPADEDPRADPATAPGASRVHDPVGEPVTDRGDGTWELRTDPIVLMRFSAATANAHRIHYDQGYATGIEGYPGLVVHGPLMTLSLAQVQRREQPEVNITHLTHRNVRPLFCGEPARIEPLEPDDRDPTASRRLGVVSGSGSEHATHAILGVTTDGSG